MAVAVSNVQEAKPVIDPSINYDQNLDNVTSNSKSANESIAEKISLHFVAETHIDNTLGKPQEQVNPIRVEQLQTELFTQIKGLLDQKSNGSISTDKVIDKTKEITTRALEKLGFKKNSAESRVKKIVEQLKKQLEDLQEANDQERVLETDLSDGAVGDVVTLQKADQVLTETVEKLETKNTGTEPRLDKKQGDSTGQPKQPLVDVRDPKNLQQIQRQVQEVVFQQFITQSGQITYKTSKENYEELLEKIMELFGIDEIEASSIILEFLLNTSTEVIALVQQNYLDAGYTASALGRNKFIEEMLKEIEKESNGSKFSLKDIL